MNKKSFDKIISIARENLEGKNETNFNEIHKQYGLNKITAEDFVRALREFGEPADLHFQEITHPIDTTNTINDVVISKT